MRSLSFSILIFVLAVSASGCVTAGRQTASVELEAPPTAVIPAECYSSSLAAPVRAGVTINGHVLDPELDQNRLKAIQWISRCVVPFLPGSDEEQATLAAKTTWWTLREGILLRSPRDLFRYSNCHLNGKDTYKSGAPLFVCPNPRVTWQVGIAAAQVPNYSEKKIAETRDRLAAGFSGLTDEQILAWTATLAGFPSSDPAHAKILNSTGRLKRSWLLRNPLIGFVLVGESEVELECLRDHRGWCFFGSYPDAKNFGGSKKAMLRSIDDLKRIFQTHAAE